MMDKSICEPSDFSLFIRACVSLSFLVLYSISQPFIAATISCTDLLTIDQKKKTMKIVAKNNNRQIRISGIDAKLFFQRSLGLCRVKTKFFCPLSIQGCYLRIRTTLVCIKPHCEDVEADLVFH